MNRRDFLKGVFGSAVAVVAGPLLPAQADFIPFKLNSAQRMILGVDPAAPGSDFFGYALHDAKKDELVWRWVPMTVNLIVTKPQRSARIHV